MQFKRNMKVTVFGVLGAAMAMTAASTRAQGDATILKPADAQRILPPSVFYCGLTSTIQFRNSGGNQISDGSYVLVAMVDTSGHCTGIRAKYQAYLITEVPIRVHGQNLSTGVYGIGFIANDKFVVTDVGARDVLTVASATDNGLRCPYRCNCSLIPEAASALCRRKYVVLTR